MCTLKETETMQTEVATVVGYLTHGIPDTDKAVKVAKRILSRLIDQGNQLRLSKD